MLTSFSFWFLYVPPILYVLMLKYVNPCTTVPGKSRKCNVSRPILLNIKLQPFPEVLGRHYDHPLFLQGIPVCKLIIIKLIHRHVVVEEGGFHCHITCSFKFYACTHHICSNMNSLHIEIVFGARVTYKKCDSLVLVDI